MIYQPRELETKLKQYTNHFSVIGITGPRQAGKSTLLLHTLPDYAYVTFDDHRIIDFFYYDPQKFMHTYADRVIFDEVQKVPELFNHIKLAVDKDRSRKGKYILTGSSQFSFIKGVSETLAGRIGLLSLLPYQCAEIPVALRDESLFRGGYPELVNRKYELFSDWMSSYLETYLLKDITALVHIGDMRDFRRFISLLAAHASQILNMSRYASDLGVDVKTIKRWISILEASYIIFLLPPFYKNYGKRLVKSPKVYFYDTGLVSYLTGIDSKDLFERGPLAGAIFENYIIADILKRESHHKTHAELFYLRTSNGDEVDLIIDRKHTKELIEIKNSYSFHPRMLKAVEQFLEKGDQAKLIYRGEPFPYGEISICHYHVLAQAS